MPDPESDRHDLWEEANGMWGVSVAIGVLSLIGAVLIATFGRMKWPRVAAALTLTAAAGLIGGSFGPALHGAMTTADHAAGSAIGRFTGQFVGGLIGVVVVGIWALLVYHNQIDMRTLGFSLVVPLVVGLIPGAVGTVIGFIVGVVPKLTAGIISAMFFGHWG